MMCYPPTRELLFSVQILRVFVKSCRRISAQNKGERPMNSRVVVRLCLQSRILPESDRERNV